MASTIIKYLHEHPAIVGVVGVCPVIAKSTTLLSGLTLGIVFLLVLLLSALSTFALRKLIPHRYRLVFILLITASWVTVLDLLLQATVYDMRLSLSMYIPLLAMNSLVLMLLETTALRDSAAVTFRRTAAYGAVMVFLCLTTGLARELLSRGTALSDVYLLTAMPERSGTYILELFATTTGAYLVLGCVLAALNFCWFACTMPASRLPGEPQEP